MPCVRETRVRSCDYKRRFGRVLELNCHLRRPIESLDQLLLSADESSVLADCGARYTNLTTGAEYSNITGPFALSHNAFACDEASQR